MRITNSKHVPWFIFVVLSSAFACWLYLGNFHPGRLSPGMQLPESLRQIPSDHRSIGGTPLGLWFGSISLGIFVFAALLSLRKKIPLWRVGTVQRWLRAHIWLTFLTIPLVILHSGFRLGGAMTMLLMALYAIVMISGIYGLILQHHIPRLMKERLPAETVFEQIPHIRAQLFAAAEKMRDSLKPAPPKKPDAGAPAPSATKAVTTASAAMASTSGTATTPVARAKTTAGSEAIAAPVAAATTTASAVPAVKVAVVAAGVSAAEGEVASKDSAASDGASYNAAAATPSKKAETIGTPTARVQSEPPGSPVPRSAVPAGDEAAPSAPVASAAPVAPSPAAKPAAPAKPAVAPKPPSPAKPPPPPADPASEAALVEFIERQVLPYLGANSGKRYRLGNPRFAEETFRFVKLRVAEAYRSRVEEIQAWCEERRMLDLQVRLQHWLHGWLFVHVPFSFLLLMLTIWHAVATLFYY